MELKDKIVVITGGTKGLGKALAFSFLKNKAKVVVCSRDEKRPEDLEENILWYKADVTKEEELQKLMDFVVDPGENVFTMVPSGAANSEMIFGESAKGEKGKTAAKKEKKNSVLPA